MRVINDVAIASLPPVDWDATHVVSRALVLEMSSAGSLLARASVASPPMPLTWDALAVVGLFATPRTPRDVFAESGDGVCAAGDFASAVDALLQSNILIKPERARANPDGLFSSGPQHHTMLKDVNRLMAYRMAIARHVAGRSVVEIGAGTGLLSIFAAQAGATRVEAIEETAIAEVAREMVAANACSDRVTVHMGHSRNITLPKPADVLIHEIIGVDPLDENILPTLADATQRFLKPGGISIPHRLEICCFAFEVAGNPYSDKDTCVAEAAEMDRIYGLDFGPYRASLDRSSPAAFERPLDIGNIATFRPRLLSRESQLLDLDLSLASLTGGVTPVQRRITITDEGIVGGLLLHFRAHLDESLSISNSLFAPPTSWRRGVKSIPRRRVRAGDTLALSVGGRTIQGRQRLDIRMA